MPTEQSSAQPPEFLPPWSPDQDQPPTTATIDAAPEAPVATATLPAAPAVPVAPAPVGTGVVYCSGCGNPINPRATVCVNCGVAPQQAQGLVRPANPKSKTTAVVLAVLFGLLGWCYTYQRDAWKLWLNLGLTVVTLGLFGLVAWVWAIVDMSIRDSAWYESFPNGR